MMQLITRVLPPRRGSVGSLRRFSGNKSVQRFMRLNIAASCPFDEFHQIYPPVGRFAVVDPTLRLAHPLAEISLSEAGRLPQAPQKTA
jgi:hypothetical protein